MAKKSLTVLLIEDGPQYAHLVQHWLSGAGDGVGFELNWTDTLAAGMSRLEEGGIDVILLDLGLPDCNGMDTYTRARARAPKTPIVILSSADSESLALQMIQEGAEDYLVKTSCDAEALIRSVRYAIIRRKSQIGGQTGAVGSRVIGVLGTKGGVGTTTIACTLASELRQQTNQEVLLADLDPDGGNVSFLMGLEFKHSLRDTVANGQRLDLTGWETIVAQGTNGLKVISSAGLPGDNRVETGRLRDVLRFTQPLYPWTVLDLGRLNQDSFALLGSVSEVFVVTTSSIPALHNTKRVTEVLRTAEIEPERVRLIVNQAEAKTPLSPRELNNMFGVPVYATIPADTAELYVACVEKRLPGAHTPVRRAIAALARKLTGQAERPRKGKFTSLISLAGRFRKPASGHASASGGAG